MWKIRIWAMFLCIKTKLTYIKKDSAALETILGISHNCLLMEAFVNNFQQLICLLYTFFSLFWSVFIKNRHKGQKLYQKSHIPVTLLLPDSTTIQNLDKISESWNIQIFTIFHFLKLIFDGQKIITYHWNGWIIVNKV